jgi:hypothetical protein
MKITRRQLRQLIKEEVTKGISQMDVHKKISSVADWLQGIGTSPNNAQKGAGHIMYQLIDLAAGNKSYDETLTVLNTAVASAKKNYPLEKK